MKKIIYITIFLLIFGCKTIDTPPDTVSDIKTSSREDTRELENDKSIIMHKKLSESIIISTEEFYQDYAILILDLINQKNWEEISYLTDESFYNSYVVESSGSIIDYCMFMLHTGDKGVSTNYSLDEISSAFYTSSTSTEDGVEFEGIYLYPSTESEYFKVVIKDNNGLIITRE